MAALAEHHAAGRLSLAELEERVYVAYRAVNRADLDAVLTDLPRLEQLRPLPAPNTGCAGLGRSWAAWLMTGVICLIVWVASSIASGDVLYFWPMWVIGPWGAVMVLSRLRLHDNGVGDRNG